MALKDQITEDMKNAMRAKEAGRLATIRLILAEIKRKEVDEQITVSDEQTIAIVEKMIKQRKDSITQFEAGGRADLAEIEKAELAVLSTYMPAGLSDEEIAAEVAAAVAASGAAGPQDMGKVMGIVKPKLAGRADMTVVSALVKKALAPAAKAANGASFRPAPERRAIPRHRGLTRIKARRLRRYSLINTPTVHPCDTTNFYRRFAEPRRYRRRGGPLRAAEKRRRELHGFVPVSQ
jgi:uncharacterized protein YqeY